MSSETTTDMDRLRQGAANALRSELAEMERIGGGRNSQVFRVKDNSGKNWALKVYFRHQSDSRDRLAVEYGSFEYLWASGLRQVPRPVACDHHAGWAIYQFIEGRKMNAPEIDTNGVRYAAEFLGSLHDLAGSIQPGRFGIASEARFCPAAIAENVEERLRKLQSIGADSPCADELKQFLDSDFCPILNKVVRWSREHMGQSRQNFEAEIPLNSRTLSPSDFGFHNALLQPDGRIIFLDFEYFGWDDPAKMIADFLLHPAMEMAFGVKQAFTAAVLEKFGQPELIVRLESVYPLFGLKWCMIMLNEFLPESLRRRQFAATEPADLIALRRQQLAKARKMLHRIEGEYRLFPYRD